MIGVEFIDLDRFHVRRQYHPFWHLDLMDRLGSPLRAASCPDVESAHDRQHGDDRPCDQGPSVFMHGPFSHRVQKQLGRVPFVRAIVRLSVYDFGKSPLGLLPVSSSERLRALLIEAGQDLLSAAAIKGRLPYLTALLVGCLGRQLFVDGGRRCPSLCLFVTAGLCLQLAHHYGVAYLLRSLIAGGYLKDPLATGQCTDLVRRLFPGSCLSHQRPG